jgi:AcrR family transcriptional regulator
MQFTQPFARAAGSRVLLADQPAERHSPRTRCRHLPRPSKPSRSGAPRSRADAPSTRDNIIAVAEDIIASAGVDSLRLADIASRLSVTSPAIYGHFPDGRSGVVAAVELRALDAMSQLFQNDGNGEPRERLLAGVRDFVRLFVSHPAFLRVMLLDFATPGGLEGVTRHIGPPGEVERSGALRPMHDRLTVLIAQSVDRPKSSVSSWTFFNAILGATFINVLHTPSRDARGRAPFGLEAEIEALAEDYLRRYGDR